MLNSKVVSVCGINGGQDKVGELEERTLMPVAGARGSEGKDLKRINADPWRTQRDTKRRKGYDFWS